MNPIRKISYLTYMDMKMNTNQKMLLFKSIKTKLNIL